jgi:hypothetical protein
LCCIFYLNLSFLLFSILLFAQCKPIHHEYHETSLSKLLINLNYHHPTKDPSTPTVVGVDKELVGRW